MLGLARQVHTQQHELKTHYTTHGWSVLDSRHQRHAGAATQFQKCPPLRAADRKGRAWVT